MIRNYFKTAFRNLWRNRSFTIINIAGLAVGIAVCLIIFMVIQFERSFDNFHAKKDRIYRIVSERHSEDGMFKSSGVPYPLPTAFHSDYPGIISTVVSKDRNVQIVIPDEKTGSTIRKFREEDGFYLAEPSFFQIFDFPLIAGEYTSLKDPNTAVISRSTATRYFGDWKIAIGKTFREGANRIYTVKGVMEDLPKNTDFTAEIIASFATRKDHVNSTDWQSLSSGYGFYLLLPEGKSASTVDADLKTMMVKYTKDDKSKNRELVQSLSEVHYDAAIGNFLDRTISPRMINTLWLIAAFILLIACVNFVNLSTAQAVNRAKEVGVRKVLGGNRRQLRAQFFSETSLVTLFAVILAVLITTAAIPYIAKVLGLPLDLTAMNDVRIFIFLVAIAAVVIFLAGFYPAIVLSRFNPVTALKSKIASSKTKGVSLRRGLVVFQFVIAQGLIIGTLIIVQQMDYFRSTSMGFDKDAVVNISIPADSAGRSKIDYIKSKLLSLGGIENVSASFASPADDGNWGSNFRFENAAEETNWSANLKWADADYIKTYGLTLVAGRDLSISDTAREFLVSETLLKRLGITDPKTAINKQIDLWGMMKFPIVGVVKDFHAMSLREGLVPVLIASRKGFYRTIGIKLKTQDIAATMKNIERLWNDVYPDFVFERRFLDAKVAAFYTQENQLSQLYKVFAALAIFLSCLGLYGLASFMAVQRIKEVGIRKVLGASVSNIVLMFSREFVILIAIAFVIAAPLTWYFMHAWLLDFVYRINISIGLLLLAGLLAIVVAILTISVKAVKAAMANPVKSLRAE